MSGADPIDSLQRQIQQQSRRVQGLRVAVYAETDPSASRLRQQLAGEEARLRDLENQLATPPPAETNERTPSASPQGRFLGPKTTGLQVEPTLNMQPISTGVYHLLDPETDPLLTVRVSNVSRDARRVCIKAFLEGFSAQAVRTVEVEPRKEVTLKLQPTLLPERALSITEVQRATLHVIVEDLDGKLESHDTLAVVCLARTSSFNSVRNPETGQVVDLSHYYGAWVTPHSEPVQAIIRRAADLLPDRQVLGYQGEPDSVPRLVGALYQALKEAGLTYINSVIDYGAPAGQSTQRTRLPREALAGRAANCIDGTVLFASLLEGTSLNAAIALVPGHAFVGWETWEGAGEWRFLETTMIGSHDFESACRSGLRQHDEYREYNPDRLTVHRLGDLRSRGIWPME
jgi:hypothetical protein